MAKIIAADALSGSRAFVDTIHSITKAAAFVANMSMRRALANLEVLTRPRETCYVCPVGVIIDAFEVLHALKLVSDLPQRFVGASFGPRASRREAPQMRR